MSAHDLVAEFIAARGVTRGPAAAVLETTATISAEDRAALEAHAAALAAKDAGYFQARSAAAKRGWRAHGLARRQLIAASVQRRRGDGA